MRKFLSLALACTMLLMCSLSVSASNSMDISEGSTTGTTPSGFNVTDDLVGAGVTVTIPANLDLIYNEQYGTFNTTDVVGVRGDIIDTAEVVISLDKEVTYTLTSEPSKTVTGYVNFGDTKNGVCTESWNSTEVAAGFVDVANTDTRGIIVNVPTNEVDKLGDYSATVEFDIKLGFLGLYNEICPPTTMSVCNAIQTVHGNAAYQRVTSYMANQYFNSESINLSDCIDLSALATATSPAKTGYTLFYQSGNYNQYKSQESHYNAGAMVKYIELTSLDGKAVYCSRVNPSNIADTNSFFLGMRNLKVVVVPAMESSLQLHCTGQTGNTTTTGKEHDYTNIVFDNTNIKIGNATAFIKDVTSDNLFVYVPHIVYRGTKDEWKALSGSTDWVFGNAANVVTVHCYDGNLVY